jgi:hypothetical protein
LQGAYTNITTNPSNFYVRRLRFTTRIIIKWTWMKNARSV